MRLILKFTISILLITILFFLSCKKDVSCEGCAGNKVLFAGGNNGQGVSSTVDIYDIVLHTLTTAQLSEAHADLSAVVVGTKIFFAGGTGANGASKTVDIYDAATNSWSTTELSVPHGNLNAAVLNNKIFCWWRQYC